MLVLDVHVVSQAQLTQLLDDTIGIFHQGPDQVDMKNVERVVFNDVDFESGLLVFADLLCARLHHLLNDLNIFLVKPIKCLITHFPLVEVGFLHPVDQLNDLNELITAYVLHRRLCSSTIALNF